VAGNEEVDNEPQGATSESHVQFATYRQEILGAPQQLVGTAQSAIYRFHLLTVVYPSYMQEHYPAHVAVKRGPHYLYDVTSGFH